MRSLLLASLVLIAPAGCKPAAKDAQSSAGESAAQALAAQLACHDRLKPTSLLEQLIDEGFLEDQPGSTDDGVPCFNMKRVLSLPSAAGAAPLTVKAVCADVTREEGLNHRRLYAPEFPGCCRTELLAVFVSAPREAVEQWNAGIGGRARIETQWGRTYLGFQAENPWTELSCWNPHFRSSPR